MSEVRAAQAPRYAVTGVGGMLGKEILRAADSKGGAILGWDRAALDVTDAEAVRRAIDAAKPDVVIHAAAWTDVDACESDPDRAFRVNARGTVNVAAACRESGARLVTISTDYVFPGDREEPWREDDSPSPLSVYGWSKLAAEHATLELGERGVVARTAWLYAEHGRNFFRTMLRLAETMPRVRVVDDQRGSPTFAADLSPALLELAAFAREGRAHGIYHVASTGATSWAGFAREIFKRAGRRVEVEPCTTAQFPRPARRPPNSVLLDARRPEIGLQPMPPWEDGLERCWERHLAPR